MPLLVAAVALIAGCGGGSTKDPVRSEAADGAPPRSGGAIEILVVSDLNTTDPFGSSSNQYLDNTRMNALYDSLFWSEPGTGRVMPQIGESLTPEPGNTVWTLKLRPGVTFTDGTPYDAAAVKWTWDEHKNPARRSLSSGAAQGIKTTTVVDPLTLRVELGVPNANFDRIVASSLAFVPSPTAFQKDPQAFVTRPVGAGPFTLAEWTRGAKLVLKKNPAYWQGPDKPYLDQVAFRVVSDSDQSLNTIASGGADLKISSSATDASKARARDLVVRQVAGSPASPLSSTRPGRRSTTRGPAARWPWPASSTSSRSTA
jgi:peptide/nickel transport system substrate-binding protein